MDDLKILMESLENTQPNSIGNIVPNREQQLAIDNNVIASIASQTDVTYSEEQLDILKHRGGMAILACAGSGKTTILTHLLAKRILTGEIKDASTLMCTTYSKAGANELEERIDSLFKTVGIHQRVQVKTLHAMYLEILRQVNYPTDVISNYTRMKFIREACKDAKYRLGDEDLQQISTLLSFQVNNLLSDSALVKSYVFNLENMREEQYTAIRNGYNKRKMEIGQIDFDDMQLYVYSLVTGQYKHSVISYCQQVWTDYYIDEAQDVSKIQFEILRNVIKEDKNLVFIGDDDQAIYQWRGADPSIILNIGGYYDIKKFVLSTNYRCSSEIVEHAAVGIKNNTRRYDKNMGYFKEGGKISICDTGKGGSLYDITKYAYKHIKDLVDSGVNQADIAVLSRNNQHLSLLNNILYRSGIYTDSTIDMRLTKTTMYKDIKNVLHMATNGFGHHIASELLWRICIFLGIGNSISISKLQDSLAVRTVDALGFMIKNCERPGTIDWNRDIHVPARAKMHAQDIWSRLGNETKQSVILLYEILSIDDEKERVKCLLDLYLTNSSFLYKSGDRSRAINGLVEYVEELLDTIGVQDTMTIFRVTEQYEEGSMALPGSKVTLSTMHGAKGREWKHVVLFADDNITFPSFEGINNMLNKNVSMSDISASIDENRRLHYVAMTRAKEDLTIITDLSNISVFTAEALGVFKGTTNNAKIINMSKNDELDRDILTGVKELIDNNKDKYKYDVDISNLDTSYKMIDINSNTSNGSININSIPTGQSETHYD